MIPQHDVDELQAELEQLRDVFLSDRPAFAQRIAELRDRAEALLADPEPGKLFDTVQNIHRLLESLHRSVEAQTQLTSTLRKAA